jgi:hypothetical protein
MRIRGKELRYDVVKTPRKPRKGRREDQLESSGGQNLIQLFESEVVAPAPPKRKSLGVGPGNAGRLRRQPLTEEQQQIIKAGRAATKIQKIVRGAAARKQVQALRVPVAEPAQSPVRAAPVAQSPSRTALEALAPGELKAHYTRITGNKGKVGRDKMLAAIARAKGW